MSCAGDMPDNIHLVDLKPTDADTVFLIRYTLIIFKYILVNVFYNS